MVFNSADRREDYFDSYRNIVPAMPAKANRHADQPRRNAGSIEQVDTLANQRNLDNSASR
jgi:hypothetical protein